MAPIAVRWGDFEAAFFVGSPGARYFFNRSNGEVDYTSHMDGPDVRDRILRRTSDDEWLEIPRVTMDDAQVEMREFAQAEADDTLRAALLEALQSATWPRAFNQALGSDQEARGRWAKARQAGINRRLLAFCAQHAVVVDAPEFRALAD